MNQRGIADLGLRESTSDNASFSTALDAAKAESKHGAFVDPQPAAKLDAEGTRTFLAGDGTAGAAVQTDGDIVGVFKSPKNKTPKAVKDLLITAISNGGTKLDCYGMNLGRMYTQMGFVPVARMDFNAEYATDWKPEFGTPDVIFWMHNGDSPDAVATKTGGYDAYTQEQIAALPTFTDYDAAYRYRDMLLAQSASSTPGLNVDNAAGGTYNQNTEGGVENGGQMDSGRGRNGLPKNDLGIGVAYDSAGLRGVAGDRAEVGATAGRNQPVYSSDSEGRRIAPEVNEKTSGTAIADSDGRPVSVYHSTPDMDFTTFDKGDVGFHFGTQEQAAKRSNDKDGIRTIRAYLNIKNPYRVSLDIMSWRPEATAIKLYADGVISEQDYNNIVELSKNGNDYHSEASNTLREMLAAKGYDGIVYPNGFEGDGNSYIALYPEQVVIADDGKGGDARGSSGGQGANPNGSVGAAQSGFDPYSHMKNEYGTIPPGEAPRTREVDVPQSTDGTDRVSRYARTLMEAPATRTSPRRRRAPGICTFTSSAQPRRSTAQSANKSRFMKARPFPAGLFVVY